MSDIHPLLISFSGIDGAGKSTQITRLIESLESAGLTVRLITFWDDVVALKGLREGVGHKVFKGDKGVGSPDAPIARRDKNVKSPLLSVFRMALYVLDAMSLNRTVKSIRTKPSESEPDVVIFDRYIFDELVNLDFGNPFNRMYVKGMLHLATRPHVAFVLDADPDAAFARKPEYPLDFLHANRNAYLNFARVAGMTVIPAGTIDQAQVRIRQAVLDETKASLSGTGTARHLIEPNEG